MACLACHRRHLVDVAAVDVVVVGRNTWRTVAVVAVAVAVVRSCMHRWARLGCRLRRHRPACPLCCHRVYRRVWDFVGCFAETAAVAVAVVAG